LNSLDEGGGPAGAGADLAQELPALQRGVGALAGSALAGLGVVDVLLMVGQPPVQAGVGMETSAPLGHRDRGAGALVAGVGYGADLGVLERSEDAVFTGGCDVVAGAGQSRRD
jgi:hypothetical protein